MAAFTNQATLSYNNTTVNSNVVTGEIIDVLAVTKNALEDSYNADGTITYIVNITNTGAVPYTDITLTDNLGEYTFGTQRVVPLDYVENSARYFVNGEVQPTISVQPSGTGVEFSGITIPANGNAQVLYKAQVNSFAPLTTGSTITNLVTADSVTIQRMPVTASETITVSSDPVLSIVKSVSPSTVTENGTITYTFTIQNTGNTAAEAADNVVVTDIFNPVLALTGVTLDGTPTTQYTYENTTGTFTTNAGAITVPAAIFAQNADGSYVVTPGTATLIVTGTI